MSRPATSTAITAVGALWICSCSTSGEATAGPMTTRTDPSADAGTSAPQHPRVAAVLTVVFLGVTAGVQMSAMGLQAISLSAIQQTFGVGDAAAGALQGLAGVFVGSALAVPLARFADRYSRKRVLLCLILASTAMMVLSALAPNFPLFFLGRSAAGITEFAMVPLVYSMIPDLVPERHRVAANLLFAALIAAGASGGFYFAGALLNTAQMLIPWLPQAWRSAFLMLSLAGLPLDRKSTRLNSSHVKISYAVFC